jgi:hypothetical protein
MSEQDQNQKQAQKSTTDPMAAVEALLNPPTEPQEGTEGEGEGEDQGEQGEPLEKAAAEKAKLDYELEVPMPNGEKLTLGQLKDYWQQQATHQLEVQERENKHLATLTEMRELASMMDAVPEDVRAKTVEQFKLEREKQRALVFDTIPAWKDAGQFQKGKDAINALAKEYGIEDLVGAMIDHRAIKVLHDFASLKTAVKEARDKVRPLRPDVPHGKQPAPGKAPTDADKLIARAKATGRPEDQAAAAAALLK